MVKLPGSRSGSEAFIGTPGQEGVLVWRLRLLAGAVATGLLLTAFLAIYREYNQAMAHEEASLRQLAQIAAQRIGARIGSVDQQLLEILSDIEAETQGRLSAPDDLSRSPRLHERLRRATRWTPFAAFAVFDRHGHPLIHADPGPWPSPPPDMGDSEILRRLREAPTAAPVIGGAVRPAADGRPVFDLGRPVLSSQGELLGIAVARIDVEAFREGEGADHLQPGHELTLLSAAGSILMRDANPPQALGSVLAQPPLRQAMAAGEGIYRAEASSIHDPALAGVARVGGFPLFAHVVARQSDVFTAWRRLAVLWAALAAGSAVGFAGLLETLGRHIERQRARNAQLTRRSESQREIQAGLTDCVRLSSDWQWEQDSEFRFKTMSWGTNSGNIFAANPDKVIGKRRWEIDELVIEPEALQRHRADLAARRPFKDFRHYFVEPDGTRVHCAIHGVPIHDADGHFIGYRGTGSNITAMVEAARELESARDRAEAANRAKSEFLATMSHEIRTPLNAVIGMTGLLMDTSLTPDQKKDLRIISDSGRQLLAIVNDILDVSRLEAGRMRLEHETFSVAGLFRDVSALMGSLASAKGLSLSIAPGVTGLPHLQGDAGRIGQILLNLVSNAIKFTETGGITLDCRIVSWRGGEAMLRFEVTDTGIGIAPEDRERLFTRFTQLDASSSRRLEGSGLGLAICRELLALMEGEIGVESEPGRGSCFWFTLRLPHAPGPTLGAPAGAGGAAANESQIPRHGARRPRVLAAEDDPANRRFLEVLLRRSGYHVDIVAHGAEAVHALRTQPYDIVLMDAHMPEMDGIAATARIRQLGTPARDTPIIALTADALAGDRERYVAAGMDDYVPKPLDAQLLLATIERILRERRPGEHGTLPAPAH